MKTSANIESRWVKLYTYLVLLFVLILLLSACSVPDSRNLNDLIIESIEVSDFDQISYRGIGELIITQTGEEALTIETNENILRYIEIDVRNNTLYIENRNIPFASPTRLTYTLSVDQLTDIYIGGSGDIIIDDIETNSLEIEINGSGDIQCDDIVTEKLEIMSHGSGDIEIESFSTETAEFKMNASGQVEVKSATTKILDVRLSGSGRLKIDSLFTEELEIASSGSGDVRLEGEAPHQIVKLNGSGDYQAGDLKGETIEITIGSSGGGTVWATDFLDVHIGGSGGVGYYGNPLLEFSGRGSGDLNNFGEK